MTNFAKTSRKDFKLKKIKLFLFSFLIINISHLNIVRSDCFELVKLLGSLNLELLFAYHGICFEVEFHDFIRLNLKIKIIVNYLELFFDFEHVE